ncbi:quinone oxidoreductase family protein [Paenibacillus guangzhouensis]|uniref:quinone oxidoreductase family protein n=1 Tax=Paenibacillus guangzhouensis TaxID=1473112 RepID=UPI001266A12A|nr:zinc-binding dehydrogenase [Paenibacillus guangzhouensis]
MKAVLLEQFGSTEHMKYVDVEVPSIRANQLLIRVSATCVNFADIKARNGKKNQGKLPRLLGLEAAGIVEQIGEDVHGFHIGQRVIAFPHDGSYAEFVVADEKLVFAIPDRMTLETAGAFGIVSFLAYQLLAHVARLQGGESVLVHAATGGVGTTVIQIAKALGAGRIIGTVGHPEKIPAAIQAGANDVILHDDPDFAEQVNSLTNSRGVDIVIDSIGGDVTAKSAACLALYGRLVICGNASGQYSTVDTGNLHASCRSVLGFSFGTTRKERPELLQETAAQVFRLFENGQLKIQIGERYSLEEAPLAHQRMESRQTTGKILLIP